MRPAPVLIALVIVAVLGLGADALLAPEGGSEPDLVAQPPAPAGLWYCPATAGPDEEAVLSVAAVGAAPSVIVVERYPQGAPVGDPPVQLTPGDQLEVAFPAGHAASPIRVRWRGGPAVATWRVVGSDSAAAPCEPAPAPVWYLSGLDTAGGARSTLHLFNPFSVDAVARVTFATPEGPIALVLTDNVPVAAGTALRYDLNEVQPEQPDLGVTVEVLAGRLVAQGEVVLGAPGGAPGPRGRALIPAASEPATLATFGFARADEGSSSWLSIMNPGERAAAVEVRVSDPSPEGDAFGEVSVPPGGLVRVDLAGLSAEPEFGVTVATVNEVPVVTARVTALRTGSGRQGIAGSLGADPDRHWALVGGGAGPHQGRIALYNPGAEPVTVELSTTGAEPQGWSGIEIPPNGRAVVALSDAGEERASLSVLARATAPVVAELRSLDTEGRLRLWTSIGIPEPRWTGPVRRPPVRREPALGRRPFGE